MKKTFMVFQIGKPDFFTGELAGPYNIATEPRIFKSGFENSINMSIISETPSKLPLRGSVIVNSQKHSTGFGHPFWLDIARRQLVLEDHSLKYLHPAKKKQYQSLT